MLRFSRLFFAPSIPRATNLTEHDPPRERQCPIKCRASEPRRCSLHLIALQLRFSAVRCNSLSQTAPPCYASACYLDFLTLPASSARSRTPPFILPFLRHSVLSRHPLFSMSCALFLQVSPRKSRASAFPSI